MFLHVFRHVDPNHRPFVIEKKLREGFGKLGFTDTGRTQKQERPDGPVLVLQAGTRATHRVGHGGYRFSLPHHTIAQPFLHGDQLFLLPFLKSIDRNTGP